MFARPLLFFLYRTTFALSFDACGVCHPGQQFNETSYVINNTAFFFFYIITTWKNIRWFTSVALELLCFPTHKWREGCCFFFFQLLQSHKMKKKVFSLPKGTLMFSCSQSLLLFANNTISFKTLPFPALKNAWLLTLPSKEKHFILSVIHNPSSFSHPALRSILVLH